MPITPVNYAPRPYVRGGSLGEILRLRGRDAAEAELRNGQIQAEMWSRLGQTVAGGINQYAEQKREEPIRARQAELADLQLEGARDERDQRQRLNRQDTAFAALLEQQPNPDPKEVVAIYGPQRGVQIAQGLHAFAELANNQVKDARETAGRLAIGVRALSPQAQAQFWPGIRQAAIKGGLGDEQSIPEQATPEYLEAVIGWATGKEQAQPEGFTLSEGQTRFGPDGRPLANVAKPEPRPEPFTLGEGQVRYGADGKPIASGPPKREPGGSEAGWTLQTVTDPNTNATRMVRVNSRTGEVQPVALPQGTQPGGQRTPRLTAGQQDDLATMQTVVDLADEAVTVGDEIGWKGVGGLGAGSASSFLAKNLGVGSDKEEHLRNYVGNIQGTVAKLRGGTAFSAAEKAMLDSYTPGIDDSDMVIKSKIASLKKFIELKRKNTLQFAGGEPQGQSGVTVNMRAPDGSSKAVPAEEVEHYKQLGATVVGQ